MSFQSLAGEFASEALVLLDGLERELLALESPSCAARGERAASTRRTLHTLKGNAALVGATALQAAIHQMEDAAARLAVEPGPAATLLSALDAVRLEVSQIAEGRSVDSPIDAIVRFSLDRESGNPDQDLAAHSDELRVSQGRIDELVATAGDLAVQNRLLQSLVQSGDRDPRAWRALTDHLDAAIRRLHDQVLRVRMVPVRQVLERYRRLVRDEAKAQGKRAALRIEGAEVAADKAVLDHVSKALVHLVRNAVAHGIESPGRRAESGKPPEGTVTLSAAQFGNRVDLCVEDDGQGLDEEAIAARARELGLAAGLEPAALVFEPGFSTAPLTQSAGRGMGMDAVKRVVYGIGGTVSLETRRGRGVRVRLRLPNSIALQRALLCRLGSETFAVPVSCVVEATRLQPGQLRWLGHGSALEYRGSLVPLADSDRLLGAASREGVYAIVLQADGLAALRVDALLGQQDFVFQPLDGSLRGPAPVSAGALLADGAVVLRLDPDALVAATARRASSLEVPR